MSAAYAKYLQPKYCFSGMFYVYLLYGQKYNYYQLYIDEPAEIKGALLC